MMGERVSLSELARRSGHSKGYIHRLKIKGVLVFDEAHTIDIDAAAIAIEEARDPAKNTAATRARDQAQRDKHGKATAPGLPLPPGYVAGGGAERDGGGGAEDGADGGRGSTYMRARTMREALGAKVLELDYKRRAGELVERRSVESAVFEAFRSLRDRLLSVPALCAPAVVGLTDPREIESAITDEMRRAFEGFESQTVQQLEARLGGAAA